MRFLLICVQLIALLYTATVYAATEIIENSETVTVRAVVIADKLNHPWSLVFLAGGDMLVTERGGRLLKLSRDGKQRQRIEGLPWIEQYGQGGLLDVVVHPKFSDNHLVYLSYAGVDDNGRYGTEVLRAVLQGTQLKNSEVLFRLLPKSRKKYHFGSRLVFDREGKLYITLGDRGERSRAQKLDDHAGSVVRIHDDGSVPEDNPFIDSTQALPEIYSYGHRNVQGATLHPQTGALWLHEHGPQGGDELNISRAGNNYGWPVITYGVEYGSGLKIGEGTEKEGMQQPLYYWVPSIAPSGMSFYSGEKISQWKNNLFIGSLKFQLLVRLVIEGEKVVHEERLFEEKLGRIRDVREGPDGLIYLLTDADNGKLIRIEPVE